MLGSNRGDEMNEEDKAVFKQGRPYVVGLVALAFQLRKGLPALTQEDEPAFKHSFDSAEKFVKEFEKRNGIDA